MNLNDFVVLPNNKARSVKLNARNLQELQMKTMSLAQESKEMEEKLQQLKESMGKEKEERGHSGGFRWKSGHCGSLNSNPLTNSAKQNTENRLQKLSAGKVKIRVLKDEPLTAPPQPLPPPLASTTRKSRLRGTICGQCEVKAAGLICAECTENYCISCFAKFHQKGALKLHKMIPIQTDLQTHVRTPDVINCFKKQIDHGCPGTFTNISPSLNFKPRSNPHHTFTSSASPRKGDQSPEKGPKDVAELMPCHSNSSQVLAMNYVGEKNVEVTEDGLKRKNEEEFPMSFLRGENTEEEAARSFQEALKQWRGEKSDPTEEPTCEGRMWKPIRPVSVSAIATQVDLPPDRGAEGHTSGGGVGRIPVMVKFTENNLTYMDRLLLKKHRRTPVEPYRTLLGFGKDLKLLPDKNTEEETANNLTAQEEDFHKYCASLFAVPVSGGRTEPRITEPESCLVIEVLDETDRDVNGVFAAVQRTDKNKKAPSVQWVSSKRGTLVPQETLTSDVPSSLSLSSPSSTQPSSQSRMRTQTKAAQGLNPFKPQTSQTDHSLKSMPSKSKLSACPTAETPCTSKTSIKTPTSKSQMPNFSSTVHKSTAHLGSPQLLPSHSLPDSQSRITKLSHSPPLFSPNVSPVQKDFGSSLLTKQTLEQPQSSQLFPEPISSAKLSQLPNTNLKILTQSQHSLCVPASPPPTNQLQHPLTLVSSKPNPQPKSLESSTSSDLSLFSDSPPDTGSRYKSTLPYEDASIFMSSTPITGDHESALSQDIQHIPSFPLHQLNVIQNSPSPVKIEDGLSIDSRDEISSDSLGLASHEEDSSDEEAQMHRHIMTGRSRGKEQGNLAISLLGDSFVPADAEREEDLQTDEPEQLPEPSMVLHNQSAGSGSELVCDLQGFVPLGLDMNSGHSETPEHTHCDPLHTCQTSLHDSDPTGSDAHEPGSSFSSYSEEHLVFNTMKDNHSHSATPTGGGERSANEMATSELGTALRPFSQAAQEIMEICSVDRTGCEDPDLDTDTAAHTLHSLEQELRLMTNETGVQASVFCVGYSRSQDQRGNQHLTQGRVDKKQEEEEEAEQRDRQSVLLLP